MSENSMNKPTCNVRGLVAPHAMCSHIIVGMKYCGFRGDCEHKSSAEVIVKLVKDASRAIQTAPSPDSN